MDFGLFLASDFGAEVLVESSGSPSGYGSRRLTPGELGNLWDVPLLFLDTLTDVELSSPPSKLLHTGADVLLTDAFRGGCKGTCSAGRIKGGSTDTCFVPGPHPLLDKVLGLAPASRRVDTAAGDLVDLALTKEVTKGDIQKADNAAVPDSLWSRAFVLGYGTEDDGTRHLEALGLAEGNQGHLGCLAPPGGWQGALLGLCSFALQYWHSRATRGYICWRLANVALPPNIPYHPMGGWSNTIWNGGRRVST